MTKYGYTALFTIWIIVFVGMVSYSQTQKDLVNGNLIQFNDNGAWCWYQDERAVIDFKSHKLITGSDASKAGIGAASRSGDIDAVVFDLGTGLSRRYTLMEGGRPLTCDDHNAPAFLILPNNKCLSMYAGHNANNKSYYRIYEPYQTSDSGSWWSQQQFDWSANIPGGVNWPTTYSNLYYLSSEGRTYNFSRGHNKSPNIMISTDMGETWSYGGQLTSGSSTSYNNGYYQYWSNGVDRIDFVFTEAHPRDTSTSIYHGYIQNGKSYRSDSTLVDDNILDTAYVPTFHNFTKVFAEGTVIGNITMRRCWLADIVRYSDGIFAAIITARSNDNTPWHDSSIDPDHNFIYCRYDGISWSYAFLGKAGKKMFSTEADYTGLGALCPNNPNTLYISTPCDPRDTTINLGAREIFKGVTTNNGSSWTWTPVTQNSVRSNFRPIVPLWDNDNNALLWWRGTYYYSQSYDAAIVGIIEHKLENAEPMNYVDASHSNTFFATGEPFVTTGPDSNQGLADGIWHERLGYGNGGSVFTSAEIYAENAPAIKTIVILSESGTYDVWVNFWANPDFDWRIKAGLSESRMQVFRQMASKQIENGDHANPIILTGGGNTFLYQAYLGRIQASANNSFEVFVDDSCIKVGTDSLIGNTTRTWYDGISYAKVNNAVGVSIDGYQPVKFTMSQNYPNPFNPVTKISYSIPQSSFVTLKVYDMLGREIRTLVNERQTANQYSIDFNAGKLSSGVYFYRLKSSLGFSEVKKMVLIR